MHRLLYEGLVNANHGLFVCSLFFFFSSKCCCYVLIHLLLVLFWIWAFVYRENDTGVLSYKEHLPVQEIVIGDTYRQGSEAMYVVGPLQCSGDSTWTELICSSVVKHDVWKQEDKWQIILCIKGICKRSRLSNIWHISFFLPVRVPVECCIFLSSGFKSAVPSPSGRAFPRCLLLLQDCFPLRGLFGKQGHSRLYQDWAELWVIIIHL